MLEPPNHLVQIDTPRGLDHMWARFIPRRLESTRLKNRKQLWYIHPADWNQNTEYIDAHEEEVRVNAIEGGIGVLVYDIRKTRIPENWMKAMIPFAEMHQRLHRKGDYDRWLVKTFVLVPDGVVFAALNAVLTGAWRPTRPLEVVTEIADVHRYVERLWRPREDP